MVQDITGIFLASMIFPTLLIAPGYIAARYFNLLNFADRKLISKMGIALLISSSISPAIFFLTDRLVSRQFTLITVFLISGFFIAVLIKDFKPSSFSTGYRGALKITSTIGGVWVIFAILFLTDIQWGNRLYYNIAGFDYSTRAAVINAITRTGVPPINPGYYPGHHELLTFLYYFWYVLCSIIDQLGGRLVDARTALMASVIWTGLALMAAVGLFIQLRNPDTNEKVLWKKVKIGLGFLLVSGLDVFPSALFILFPQLFIGRMLDGDIEQWNEQVTAWIGAVTWTPHHVISLLACITAWILIASSQNQSLQRQLGAVLISGIALASAFGLSVWIVLIFAVFWMVWLVTRLINKEPILHLWTMLGPGFIAGIVILPFIIDLVGGSTGGSTGSQFPLALSVREFFPLEIITVNSPFWESNLIKFAVLPINYFLELGFFSAVGILWFWYCRNGQQNKNKFLTAEISLFLTTLLLVTFVRSAVIAHNDFGWRGWMFAQFILLIWGVDLVEHFFSENAPVHITLFQRSRKIENVRKILIVLIAMGAFTSLFDVAMLRFWPMVIDTGVVPFPRILSRDTHFGERTFAAREIFTYIDTSLPSDFIVQFSPGHIVDSLSGLYRTRPSVISYNTLYGVGPQEYDPLINGIQKIFDAPVGNWNSIDTACHKHNINVLIIRDIDPLWQDMKSLLASRKPLHINSYFAIFTCGN